MFGIMDRLDTNARLSDQDKLGNLKLAWQQLKLLLAHHDPRAWSTFKIARQPIPRLRP
ncbi:hypothetical protein [Sporisorium scitamineum]|uniref:Uncharacterized protein n=1 Tax=Sporisorium scitamineum TaxID=49012 RepID=A0A0F7S4Z7_9BASI|nr:hypothetical protein [Sporisorium scitamineum]